MDKREMAKLWEEVMGLPISRMEEIFDNPEFDKPHFGPRIHDWRTHIPEWAIIHWNKLSNDMKLGIILMAEEVANNEEWD